MKKVSLSKIALSDSANNIEQKENSIKDLKKYCAKCFAICEVQNS